MRKHHNYTFIISLCFIAAGLCIFLLNKENNPGYQALSPEVREMLSQKGWSYHKTLGTPGKPVLENWFSSSAKTATAFWTEKGASKKETFDQKEERYTIVSCQKEDGDSFSVIFKKR